MKNPFKRDPDPFAASRYADVVKSVRTHERRHMRHGWQWGLLAFFVLVTVGAGLGMWKYYSTQCKISCGGPPTTAREEGEPFNALLVGSDSRGDLTRAEQRSLGAGAISGERADTLILAHIDPAESHVIMVQFPRDLWVPLAGGGENKINAALAGGSQQMLRTMQQLTGLEIHHYVQVNIAGFRDLVDAIGGVDVCVPEAIPFDRQTGLEIGEPGMVHFDGDLALRFVRSRAFTTGDFERIQNQQKFIAAAIDKIVSAETLLLPGRILKLADVAGKNLRTDVNMTLLGLRDLANQLRSLDPQHYEAYTAPNLGIGNVEGQSVVVPDDPTLKVMFAALARNESPGEADGVPDVDPSTISVGVYNGTPEVGVAAAAAEALREATTTTRGAVAIAEVGNARRLNHRVTTIHHRPVAAEKAMLVAAAIPGAELVEGRTPQGIDVAVVVGRRFRARKIVQIVSLDIPRPGDVPEVCR